MRRRVRKRGRRGLGVVVGVVVVVLGGVVAGGEEVEEEEEGGGWAAIGWVGLRRGGLVFWLGSPQEGGVLVLARGGLRRCLGAGVLEKVARLCPLSGFHLVLFRCVAWCSRG